MPKPTTPETLGAVVQSRRTQLSISREKLAASAGVSTSTIVRIERDNAVPLMVALLAIGRALDLPDAEILTAAAATSELVA